MTAVPLVFIGFISFFGMMATVVAGKICQTTHPSFPPVRECGLPEWFMSITLFLWLAVFGLTLYAARLAVI